jgi:RecB family exonuclease
VQLEKWYQESWIDDWYISKKQKEEYRAKGYVMLKTFFEETIKKNPKPKFIEKSFKLHLGQDRFEFVGKIDRADTTPEGLAIYDYKTGKSGNHDVDQLTIYQWACQDYFQEKVASMCYWYLEENKCEELPLASNIDIDALKDQLLKTIQEIREAVQFDLFAELNEKSKQHECLFDGYR